MLGPLIGGALLTYFWWGSVFLISVPLMVLFLLASHLLVDSRDKLASPAFKYRVGQNTVEISTSISEILKTAKTKSMRGWLLSNAVR